MTPYAEMMFNFPADMESQDFLRHHMAGAQYFDCSNLKPILNVRQEAPGDPDECYRGIEECVLPAPKTWIDYGDMAIMITTSPHEKTTEAISRETSGKIVVSGAMAYFDVTIKGVTIMPFQLINDKGNYLVGSGKYQKSSNGYPIGSEVKQLAEFSIQYSWYTIEAMQTPGGLCHAIDKSPSRQAVRSAKRAGKPVHQFVEIRLGRKRSDSLRRSDSEFQGKTCWHYRRGHRVNHPNPNYPKWRRGGWVGDPSAGINTHLYSVEIPT